ncbi:CobW family GTP-binding protein [Halomonas sp. THAF12]|uniref:CobW family GTP-binding protein n=1 Tax=Halomonas sp. B23F22_10 TaxID=3459515 RepID=UPI00373F8083
MTVIGGFLGAGKTTYLNALIRGGIPENSLIVINDFGDINIDAELIDYRDEQMIQLTNGCICCTLGGTLAERLAKAMRLREAPRAVFIETSGVADPARIADLARVSHRLTLEEVVCLVDGGRIDLNCRDPLIGDTWRAQIQAATRILVNRLSAVHDPQACLGELRRLNAAASIHDMGGGQAGPPTKECLIASPVAAAGHLYHDVASQRGWRSASLAMPHAVDPDRLGDILTGYGDVLLRAKGFVFCLGRQQRQLLQFSGRRLSYWPAPARNGRCQLVCIGRAGPRFEELVATLASLGDGEGMAAVL